MGVRKPPPSRRLRRAGGNGGGGSGNGSAQPAATLQQRLRRAAEAEAAAEAATDRPGEGVRALEAVLAGNAAPSLPPPCLTPLTHSALCVPNGCELIKDQIFFKIVMRTSN